MGKLQFSTDNFSPSLHLHLLVLIGIIVSLIKTRTTDQAFGLETVGVNQNILKVKPYVDRNVILTG